MLVCRIHYFAVIGNFGIIVVCYLFVDLLVVLFGLLIVIDYVDCLGLVLCFYFMIVIVGWLLAFMVNLIMHVVFYLLVCF